MAGIKVITRPAVEPLTLSQAKKQLELAEDDTTHDDYVAGLIMVARGVVEKRTARALVKQTMRQYFDGFPPFHHHLPANLTIDVHHGHSGHKRERLELDRSPLQEVVQIQYLDPTGVETIWDKSDYVVNDAAEPAAIYRAPGVCWPRAQSVVNAVWVDYVAGYSDDGAEVSPMLLHAMKLLITHWFENREPIQSASMSELPFSITSLLDLERVYYQP